LFGSHIRLFRVVAILLTLAACGSKRDRYPGPPVASAPLPPAVQPDAREGVASWYGHPFHGRRTSNGEVYDMDTLTAAHQTLPFDSLVRVDNLDNGKSVKVRINDRGPFVKNRIIDLSRAAATAIGMIGPGTARVQLAILEMGEHAMSGPITATGGLAESPCEGGGYFAVQVGSFSDLDNAQRMRGKVGLAYGAAAIHRATADGKPVYRVLLGRFSSKDSAGDAVKKLAKDGLDSFVKTVEQTAAACLDDVT